MRFEELSLRIPGDELRMRFHKRITVLSGLEVPERRGLVDSLLGTLVDGPAGQTVLVYRDGEGQRVTVSRTDDGAVLHTYDDGSLAPDLTATLGLDGVRLRELSYIDEAGVGLFAADLGTPESPELAEARAALTAITQELDSAMAARQAVEVLRQEIVEIEERLREADEGGAKRRYARILAQLERVRAEAAAARTGDVGAASDRRFMEHGKTAVRLARRWTQVNSGLEEAQKRFGRRERLDAATLAQAEATPDRVPAKLDNLVRAYTDAEARREDLADHLASLATARLPEPSHPAVVRLASADQDAVWATARHVLETAAQLDEESLALGGLETVGVNLDVATQIEMAHAAVEEAERMLAMRRKQGLLATGGAGLVGVATLPIVPLVAPVALIGAAGAALWSFVGPRKHLQEAEADEQTVLQKAGVPTYLSFHMRRIDATIDPNARERLHLSALEHRMALSEWQELAGDLAPADALALEQEVRRYAGAVASLGGAADEIDAARRELGEVVEPAADKARAALMRACAPFGVDDPELAAGMVRQQAELAATAHLQRLLEKAEAEEAEGRDELEAVLDQVGIEGANIAGRVAALEEAVAGARRRDQARTHGRSREEIEAELGRLEALARREHRPEWGATVVPDDSEEPDVTDLSRRRAVATQAYETAATFVPDVEHLADRKAAVERRVHVLEASLDGEPSSAGGVDTEDVRQQLIARLTGARKGGDESLPVVLDDPLVRVRGEQKWDLLDLIERVADKTQIVYLTDDHDVVLWARRRAGGSALALLEPVTEMESA
ncbi:MAG TPA: hypothetical protein VG076_15105 [Acidimicrobiales bacterium]|nr:hypothetical protein [Acidimicrobiales bacterium]